MKRRPLGFTMIEMMVVIFLIGVIAAIALPRFALRPVNDSWRTVQEQLESVIATARQEAVSKQRTCRLSYMAKQAPNNDTVVAEQEKIAQPGTSKKDEKDEAKKQYEPLSWPLGIQEYTLPPTVHLHRLFVDGKQLIDDGSGKATWLVGPTGLTQSVVWQYNKKMDATSEKVTLWLHAFDGSISMHEGHVRPDKEAN